MVNAHLGKKMYLMSGIKNRCTFLRQLFLIFRQKGHGSQSHSWAKNSSPLLPRSPCFPLLSNQCENLTYTQNLQEMSTFDQHVSIQIRQSTMISVAADSWQQAVQVI